MLRTPYVACWALQERGRIRLRVATRARTRTKRLIHSGNEGAHARRARRPQRHVTRRADPPPRYVHTRNSCQRQPSMTRRQGQHPKSLPTPRRSCSRATARGRACSPSTPTATSPTPMFQATQSCARCKDGSLAIQARGYCRKAWSRPTSTRHRSACCNLSIRLSRPHLRCTWRPVKAASRLHAACCYRSDSRPRRATAAGARR